MEHTISTEDLKAKLNRKESIKVVETLASERYRDAHIPGALNIPSERSSFLGGFSDFTWYKNRQSRVLPG
jgi:3-mercaptopyruvate sulfurtransferase SseA